MLLKSNTSIKPSLKQAWNQFVLSGKVEDAVVRPVIADSWNRCRVCFQGIFVKRETHGHGVGFREDGNTVWYIGFNK